MAFQFDDLDQEFLAAHERFIGVKVPFGADMRNLMDIMSYQATKAMVRELRKLNGPVVGLPSDPLDDLTSSGAPLPAAAAAAPPARAAGKAPARS